ncbi:MAG: Mov34/MPN/PAD-1 family protein [Thermoprotei archaeon]
MRGVAPDISNVRTVEIDEEALGFLFAYARGAFPREAIVALRGKVTGDGQVEVQEAVVPMVRTEGHHFSTWSFAGVADSRMVGIGHSHPSGVLIPSDEDLRNFAGKVMLIVGPPFDSVTCARFFDRRGEELSFSVKWRGLSHEFRFDE